jgi:dipeptidyl aminopeptidase/acylaminoacyl peptidase
LTETPQEEIPVKYALYHSRISLTLLAGLLFTAPQQTDILLAQAPARAATATASASSNGGKKALNIDEYSRWRSISGSAISGDGNWVVYELRQTNLPTSDARPTLHILHVDSNRDISIANASGGTFSGDSKWVAYSIEPPGGRGGRGGRGGAGAAGGNAPAGGGAPPGGNTQPGGQGRGGNAQAPAAPRRVELRNLATNALRSWEDISSFSFSTGSGHLVLRRRAAGGNANFRGADVVLHNLNTGRDVLMGSVGDLAFNERGDMLAYTVDASVRDGNGLFIMDPQTGSITPLDNDAKNYNRLTWNEAGSGLAVLKGLPVERMRERDNILLIYPDVRAALQDPALAPVKLDNKAAGFPANWVVSDRGALDWSDNGKLIFFSVKAQVATPDTSGRRGADFVANVDIWNTRDERIQSVQMIRADADQNATFRQAVEISSGKFIKLADSTMRDISFTRDGRWGIGQDARAYASDYERPRADIYRVNTATGERTLMLKGHLTAGSGGTSPDGRYYLYWKDNHYHAYDLDANSSQVITRNVPVSFVDMEYDNPGPRPPYGVAGYAKDGKSVLLEHRYDVWVVSLDGSAPPRALTGGLGAKNETRFTYLRSEGDSASSGGGGGRGGGPGGASAGIDLTRPMLFSAYGQWSKKSGFYELRDGQMKEIVYEDASWGNPTKAAKADRYLVTRQTFAEFPDLRISGPDFSSSRKITDANPHHVEYNWGRRILFDYTNKNGVRLQGTLAIPDDYRPGEKRPMLVNFYEKNSQNLHRYMSPTYLSGMGSLPVEALTRGYLLMQPDVHFRTGSSHTDMLECVEAAVKKVIAMGYVDPKRIGINGHSYGGEGAAFIGTRSKMFAAVGMGAGVTDLYTDFSHNWGWSYSVTGGSGANGNNYYIYGQGRWGTNPWDSPELYRNESAITHVRDAVAPFLIMHGTSDPTVAFQEGLRFYNALRFNKKEAVLLAYPGEGHSLRGLANRRDLTIRYMQFFDHYLRGAPAPKWITDGVPFLAKDGTKDPGE